MRALLLLPLFLLPLSLLFGPRAVPYAMGKPPAGARLEEWCSKKFLQDPADITHDPVFKQIQRFRKARRIDQALSYTDGLVKRQPTSGNCLRHRAYVYALLTEDEKAMKDLAAACRDKKLTGDDWYAIGRLYSKLDADKEALNAFGQAVRLSSNPYNALRMKAKEELKMNLLDAAEKDLSRCVELKAGSSRNLIDLAKVHTLLKKHTLVIEDVKKAEETGRLNEREEVKAMRMRADAFVALKKWQEALKDLNRGLAIAPLTRDLYARRLKIYELTGNKTAAAKESALLVKLDGSLKSAPGVDEDRPVEAD
ncbi:MAG: hypothetical protein JNN26_04735 [Candidatus Obscuribacter sp.]|nr:hypothetical protein [Candidatus Obscuribacter sp.]